MNIVTESHEPESVEDATVSPVDTGDAVAAEPERPDWLPVQFDTPEMLAKSYREAQKKLTQVSQQSSELARENEVLTDEIERLSTARDELEARIAGLERAFVARMGAAR